MKYREILLNQLKSLPYFNKGDIYQLARRYGLKLTTVDTYISRSLARKDILPLKNGMYVTADFYEKNATDISYVFYLANVIKSPSYVSLWTALQYYDLVTEAIYTTVSVTPKATRSYQTKVGTFTYHSIKKDIFSGFSLVKGKFDFFIATPSKALFDLLYLKTNQFRGMTFEMVSSMIEELRVDIDEMEKEEQKAFNARVKKYLTRYE